MAARMKDPQREPAPGGLSLAKTRARELDKTAIILPWVVAGGWGSADLAKLKASGVTHMISLREEPPENTEGFLTIHLPMSDAGDSDLRALVNEAARFIESARKRDGRVFVFCDMGVNRTPALIVGYLIWKGWSMERALEHVGRVRPIVNIVEPYLHALREFVGERAASRHGVPSTAPAERPD